MAPPILPQVQKLQSGRASRKSPWKFFHQFHGNKLHGPQHDYGQAANLAIDPAYHRPALGIIDRRKAEVAAAAAERERLSKPTFSRQVSTKIVEEKASEHSAPLDDVESANSPKPVIQEQTQQVDVAIGPRLPAKKARKMQRKARQRANAARYKQERKMNENSETGKTANSHVLPTLGVEGGRSSDARALSPPREQKMEYPVKAEALLRASPAPADTALALSKAEEAKEEEDGTNDRLNSKSASKEATVAIMSRSSNKQTRNKNKKSKLRGEGQRETTAKPKNQSKGRGKMVKDEDMEYLNSLTREEVHPATQPQPAQVTTTKPQIDRMSKQEFQIRAREMAARRLENKIVHKTATVPIRAFRNKPMRDQVRHALHLEEFMHQAEMRHGHLAAKEISKDAEDVPMGAFNEEESKQLHALGEAAMLGNMSLNDEQREAHRKYLKMIREADKFHPEVVRTAIAATGMSVQDVKEWDQSARKIAWQMAKKYGDQNHQLNAQQHPADQPARPPTEMLLLRLHTKGLLELMGRNKQRPQ